MALRKVSATEFEFDVTQTMKVTPQLVTQQIARLTAELAKWTDLQAQISASETVVDNNSKAIVG